jgi:formyl-CoA transferase
VAFPGIVPRIGDVARAIRNLGPDLGEHTEEILGVAANRHGIEEPVA